MPEATSARFGPRVVFTKGYQPTWSPRHPLSENLHRAGQERLGRDHASDPLLPIPKAGGVSTRLWHQTGAPNWRTKLTAITPILTGLPMGSLAFGPSFRSHGLRPRHSGSASAGHLAVSRREPRFLLARLLSG